jgi:2-methylcitrate dehydratase PrpD
MAVTGGSMMPLTRSLGAFVAELRFDALPPEALDTVRLGFTDCVASLVAGRGEPVVEILRSVIGAPSAAGEARLCLGRERASATDAALVNGTAAHALDYDDVALAAHPSAVLVPAILAEAEALGTGGREMALAYVAGYEVWAELNGRDADRHHRKGWHPTSIFGVVGAAAACAALHRLDADRAAAALAIAASEAAGVVANFGSMTKPFHAGQAARGGVLAARLAAAGMTAAADAIEHPLGFLAAISPAGRVDRDAAPRLGREWRILESRLNVKRYPLCYATHRTIDGVLDMLAERRLASEEIAAIEVELGPTQATILRNHRPQTGLDAKFSEEFAMAASVVAGRVGLAELSDAFVLRPEIQAMMSKVTIRGTAEPDPEDPAFSLADEVRLQLKSGETLSRRVRYARGHARAPLGEEELWTKFRDCVGPRAGEATARALFDALRAIDRIADPAALPVIEESGRPKAA